MLDLDRFEEVNDTLGHAIGGELLRRVADRLKSAMPPHATLARIGGDEFAVWLENSSGHREVEILGQHICEALIPLANEFSGYAMSVQSCQGTP
jgi:diguanylate cyclase (GGDEF)-like protein